MKMKKYLVAFVSVFLIICLALSFCIADGAREESNEGEVILIDDLDEFSTDESSTSEQELTPFMPEGIDKAIIGKDDRYTVNPAAYPFSAISYMRVKGWCGCGWTGSGFMVGRNKLLTAAHCLVCTKHSSWAKEITFYFGYRNEKNYSYRYSGAWKAWAGNLFGNRSYTVVNDFGCVTLNESVGEKTGWFGVRFYGSKTDMRNRLLHVAGYRDGILRNADGFGAERDGDFWRYTIDMLPGNSGCPVFESDNYAIGINIAEVKNDKNAPLYNTGFVITQKVWNCFNKN